MSVAKIKSSRVAKEAARSPESLFAERLAQIDGRHPLQTAVEDFQVAYKVRYRKGGKLAYFNTDLAVEMGLVDSHETLPSLAKLEKIVLETFALQIINEYDIESGAKFDPKDVRKHPRMATRYLQLQHKDKRGKNSGDGRSIWNGYFSAKGRVWDISSCGTGATCLSPAAAELGRPIKTGDKEVSYGCGYADYYDGLAGVLMSEVFYKNGVPTERTLAVIRFEGGRSINVRVAPNLLRPAHMFRYLKNGDHTNLVKLCNFFIDREIKNKNSELSSGKNRYRDLKLYLAKSFARSAALCERRYIFCWFDWDGDNILAKDAAILDYGSIRQFGLFNKEYRYDDYERWSTNLLEQKGKARYIVQVFEQMLDFIETKTLKPVKYFANSEGVRHYDSEFAEHKKYLLLQQVGLPERVIAPLLKQHSKTVAAFENVFEYFERLQCARGVYNVSDGITSDAVFCMRDFLREIPKEYLAKWELLSPDEVIEIMKSSYARRRDLKGRERWNSKLILLQTTYQKLLAMAAEQKNTSLDKILLEVVMRSSLLNRYDQITGNGVLQVTGYLCNQFPLAKNEGVQAAVDSFVGHQSRNEASKLAPQSPKDKTLKHMIRLVEANREEI